MNLYACPNHRCGACDLELLPHVSTLLLDTLAAASLAQAPKNMSEAGVIQLKNGLFAHLGITNDKSDAPDAAATAAAATASAAADTGVASTVKDAIAAACASFSRRRTDSIASMFQSKDAADKKDEEYQTQKRQRMTQLDQDLFHGQERDVVARLVLRRFDRNFEHTCVDRMDLPGGEAEMVNPAQIYRSKRTTDALPAPYVSDEQRADHTACCRFTPRQCPFDGCTAVFSAVHEEQHKQNCGFRLEACTLGCGVLVARNKMRTHLDHACPLKPCSCPFAPLGCTVAVVKQTLPDHLDKCMPSHLLLSLGALTQQQEATAGLQQRLAEFKQRERQRDEHWHTQFTALASRMSALGVTLGALRKASEKKEAQDKSDLAATNKTLAALRKDTSATGRRAAELNATATAHTAGLARHEQRQQDFQRRLEQLEQRR